MNDLIDKYYLRTENDYERVIKVINQYQFNCDYFKNHILRRLHKNSKLNFNQITRLEDGVYIGEIFAINSDRLLHMERVDRCTSEFAVRWIHAVIDFSWRYLQQAHLSLIQNSRGMC